MKTPRRFHQVLPGAAEALYDYSLGVPVIDTHEHIPRSEADYNACPIQFGNLFIPYAVNDLASAGMPVPRDQWTALVCIGDDWDAFAPAWRHIRHGSYARTIRMALLEFYGVDDFTRENYRDLLKRINEANRPGIFQRVLREKCGIEKVVRCSGDLPDRGDPLLVGNMTSPSLLLYSADQVSAMADHTGCGPVRTLDDLLAAGDAWMERWAAEGAIQFKSTAFSAATATRGEAEEILARMLKGEALTEQESDPLRVFVREANARKCAALGLPMALHTGVWNDFRNNDVTNIIDLVKRNPDTRFDVYHLGIPRVRECINLVKNYPNAWLNLCWAHIVAPDMTVRTLKEALDMVPVNKIFAFGGDYVLFIEQAWGHLTMARENIALALGDRVDRNLLGMDEAREILRGWFYDHPKAFYRL